MPESTTFHKPDDFYVGYLPVPSALKSFLSVLAPAILLLAVFAAITLAHSQPDPGAGVWEDSSLVTLQGTLSTRPYPTLFAQDRGDGNPGAVLLVESGKHGAASRAQPFNAQSVSITGCILKRSGRFMLELSPQADAIRSDLAAATLAPPVPKGHVSLQGEIVDSKCYLGAMKPGEGKTHRECAILCARAGIPLMFVAKDQYGAPSYYLLSEASGGPLETWVLPLIGRRVELSGELESRADLQVLRVGPDSIRPL